MYHLNNILSIVMITLDVSNEQITLLDAKEQFNCNPDKVK
jgi:hypothetical protein